jgi:hypothetical protein
VTFSGVSISVLSFGATKAIGERSERGARTAFTAFILTPPKSIPRRRVAASGYFYFGG